ncbi:putative phytol kinase, chloroplastic isoform X4 [Canna indica]|uniref:phytol kinase n=1 Tax=Canna indica TaxID=4628 RepID=A0AAQ3KRQ9_9LILI|nr:putative phytol kinase, chloroplastic isoform X4 [Canna indica]
MEAAGWSCSGAAVFSYPLLSERFRHGWPLAPSKLPFAPSSSSYSFPLFRGFASVSSPPLLPSSPGQLPLLRLRSRVVSGAILQDAAATAFCFAGAYSLVLAFDALTERNILQKNLSRKAVHVLSGLLYMSTWPIFSGSAEARYFAAIVPLLNCIRLLSYGFRLRTDESLVKSITREGRPEELLRGPLYFVIILLLCVLVFWRDSPVGIVSLAMMSGGDGFADIVGRTFGAIKLPYNQQKSWVGSISMFVFGSLFSIGMLYYFSIFGHVHFDLVQTATRVALISLTATIVESLPITDIVDDNISVPLTSMLTAFLLFQS